MTGRGAFARSLSASIVRKQEEIRQEQTRLIRAERKKLDDWLQDENNTSAIYYEPIRQARLLISDDDKLVDALADYSALNKAVETKDVVDLFERARAHMAYKSPAAMAIGAAFAIAGFAVLIVATCPAVLLIAGIAFLGGLYAFALGAEQKPTTKTQGFFDAVKAVDNRFVNYGVLLNLPSP